MINRNNIKVRKIGADISSADLNKNKVVKADFTAVSNDLLASLEIYTKGKNEKDFKASEIKALVEATLDKSSAPDGIKKKILFRVNECSNSASYLLHYLYDFILRSKNSGVIAAGTTCKKLDLINRN